MADIQDIAKQYIISGWQVVPLVKGEKRASSNWRKIVYTPDNFNPTDGIAGKCGAPSGNRVDIDCDAMEAIAAAKILLPSTGLIHGRLSKPDSHYWYICEGIKTTQFTDVKDSSGKTSMLVEIRSTGGYTVLPPSRHPSGEGLTWSLERDPMDLDQEVLYLAARNVALSTLLARHWPNSGARHAAVGHLTGFLLMGGLPAPMVIEVIKTAAQIAGDKDLHDRENYARSTCAKHAAGERVTGGPKLAEEIGEDVVTKMRGWLKLADGDAIEEMNTKHFIVRVGKDELIGTDDGDDVFFQHPRSLSIRYANRQVATGVDPKGIATFSPLFDAWLKARNRRDYRTVVFAPPPRKHDPQDYNLWKGFAVAPQKGDCLLFLDHIRDIICSGNLEHYAYLMNLLALTVQEPGTPSEIATVLRGDQGTGKGIFIRALGDIFGRHYAHLDKVDDLVGTFNAAISGKVIVFADEAFWAGDKREIGSLKRLISEPTLRVTRKGIDSVHEDNCVHLFMAANEDWTYPAAPGERRAFALNVNPLRKGDFAYFTRLAAHMKAGGTAALLAQLLDLPVSHDMIRNVPRTTELRAQQGQSLSAELEWWQDCLYEGRIGVLGWPGGEWIAAASVFDVYTEWARSRRGRVLSKIEYGRRMNHLITGDSLQVRSINGERLKALRLRGLEEARDLFDAKLGTPTDWGVAVNPAQVPLPNNPF